MTEPIFRYLIVLVAVIVVIRILLGISTSKVQENYNHPGGTTTESTDVVEEVVAPEDEQDLITDSQIVDQQDDETDNE